MNEQNILIVRCGEVALKGMNKPYFERMLVDRIRQNLKAFNGVDVRRHEGLIFVRAEKDLDLDAIIKEISKVFGVASISKAVESPSELNAMGDEAVRYMMNLIEERGVKTFKVEGKRADKTFPVKSPEIGRIIGAKVLVGCKVPKVDVHKPSVFMWTLEATAHIYTRARFRASEDCLLEPTARDLHCFPEVSTAR